MQFDLFSFRQSVVLALILRFYGSDALAHLFYWSVPLCTTSCLAFQAVYRVSFALALFFGVREILVHFSGLSVGFSQIIFFSLFVTIEFHASFWIFKLLLWPAVTYVSQLKFQGDTFWWISAAHCNVFFHPKHLLFGVR